MRVGRLSAVSAMLFTERSDRRFQCVMNLEAFQAKTRSGPD